MKQGYIVLIFLGLFFSGCDLITSDNGDEASNIKTGQSSSSVEEYSSEQSNNGGTGGALDTSSESETQTDADGDMSSDSDSGTGQGNSDITTEDLPRIECMPQDARGSGQCEAWFGFYWNGKECVGYSGCDCEGTECGDQFESLESCEASYSECGEPSETVCAYNGVLYDVGEMVSESKCQPACACSEDGQMMCDEGVDSKCVPDPIDDVCAPQDAHNGPNADLVLCFAPTITWNGNECVAISCDCEGDDCDETFVTTDECKEKFSQCSEEIDGCKAEDGTVYKVGDSYHDGCNTHICGENGLLASTKRMCVDMCEYDGQFHEFGESFKSDDGCNSCSCDENGVACTEMACIDPIDDIIACPANYSPVCGTDGSTYSNSCSAGAEGVEIIYDGECSSEKTFENIETIVLQAAWVDTLVHTQLFKNTVSVVAPDVQEHYMHIFTFNHSTSTVEHQKSHYTGLYSGSIESKSEVYGEATYLDFNKMFNLKQLYTTVPECDANGTCLDWAGPTPPTVTLNYESDSATALLHGYARNGTILVEEFSDFLKTFL